MKKRLVCIVLMFCLVIPSLNLSAFAIDNENETDDITELEIKEFGPTYPEQTEEIYSLSYELSEGLTYTKNISDNEKYGLQREYIFEFDSNENTNINFISNEYIRSTGKISVMAQEAFPEENFVAGINGDFFNMSTGVPESAFIKNYEIYTSDRDNFCFAQTEYGKFLFDKPQIKIRLLDENMTEYTVMHLNKDFDNYGLFLYNNRYSTSTHANTNNTAVVLYSYESYLSLDDAMDLYSDNELLRETYEIYLDYLENPEFYSYDNVMSESEEPENLEYLNPEEVFFKAIESFSGGKVINGELYYLNDICPTIDSVENLVVYKVLNEETNTAIEENSYVLCADNLTYGYILRRFTPGQKFELVIDGNDVFQTVINAIGTGAIIVNDSQIIEHTNISHYLSPQPRTAVGIKEDGSLILYAVDGRNKGYSTGLTLKELAEQMKELGCVYAANLDGGGSTSVNVSPYGYDTSYIDSVPSGGSERRVSNAIVFTNNKVKTGSPRYVYSYKDYYITLANRSILLEDVVVSDKNGFFVEYETGPEDLLPENIVFYSENENVKIDGLTVSPSGVSGEIDIYASIGNRFRNVAATVLSLESPQTIEINSDKLEIAPFERINLNAVSKYHGIDLDTDFDSYTWSASIPVITDEVESLGSEFSEDVTDSDESITFGTFEDGVFTPSVFGTHLNISAQIGETVGNLEIYVDDYIFDDIQGHWAVKEIYNLAKSGIVKGEIDENDIAHYFPQRNYTRYEFCVMVARILNLLEDDAGDNIEILEENLDFQDESTENVEFVLFADDETIPDWAYDSVYVLYQNNYLDGILSLNENDEIVFNGAQHITREDVAEVLGKICVAVPEDYIIEKYPDLTDEQLNDTELRSVLYAGIFSGYEDSTLRLSGTFTRAEAAAVFTRLMKHIDAN